MESILLYYSSPARQTKFAANDDNSNSNMWTLNIILIRYHWRKIKALRIVIAASSDLKMPEFYNHHSIFSLLRWKNQVLPVNHIQRQLLISFEQLLKDERTTFPTNSARFGSWFDILKVENHYQAMFVSGK